MRREFHNQSLGLIQSDEQGTLCLAEKSACDQIVFWHRKKAFEVAGAFCNSGFANLGAGAHKMVTPRIIWQKEGPDGARSAD